MRPGVERELFLRQLPGGYMALIEAATKAVCRFCIPTGVHHLPVHPKRPRDVRVSLEAEATPLRQRLAVSAEHLRPKAVALHRRLLNTHLTLIVPGPWRGLFMYGVQYLTETTYTTYDSRQRRAAPLRSGGLHKVSSKSGAAARLLPFPD